MVRHIKTASSSNSVQLVVGQLTEHSAGYAECVVKFIVGVIHLIYPEHRFQATFVKWLVVGYQWQALNQRLNLLPYIRENGSIVSISLGKSMNFRVTITVIIGFRVDEQVERIYNLTIPDYYYANRTNRRTALVGCLEIYCGKIIHTIL